MFIINFSTYPQRSESGAPTSPDRIALVKFIFQRAAAAHLLLRQKFLQQFHVLELAMAAILNSGPVPDATSRSILSPQENLFGRQADRGVFMFQITFLRKINSEH
jgi:hypothetical protein